MKTSGLFGENTIQILNMTKKNLPNGKCIFDTGFGRNTLITK